MEEPGDKRFNHLLQPIRCGACTTPDAAAVRVLSANASTTHPVDARALTPTLPLPAPPPPVLRSDLAQNWNIDVARDLEEYLDELEGVEISFDGGKTSLNFAQAALLIQGSACIYSRKVEYLYTLIYQTLDMITTQSKKGKVRAGVGGCVSRNRRLGRARAGLVTRLLVLPSHAWIPCRDPCC